MLVMANRQTHAGDERTTRDPKVRAQAHKQHLANAAEWLNRIRDFANAAPGTERDALVRAYHYECKCANITPEL
jgi:hypothetical protein